MLPDASQPLLICGAFSVLDINLFYVSTAFLRLSKAHNTTFLEQYTYNKVNIQHV